VRAVPVPPESDFSKAGKTRPSEFEPITAGVIANISHEAADEGTGKPTEEAVSALANGNEETEGKAPGEIEQYLTQQVSEVVVPSYSAWFDMSTIHEVPTSFLAFFLEEKKKKSAPLTGPLFFVQCL